MKTKFLTILSASMLLYSCGEKKEQKIEETILEEPTQKTEEKTEEVVSTDGKEVSLTIEANDQMKFNKSEFKVKEGQKVTLTLKNVGKMDKTSMGHNWVLLKEGTDVADFANKSMSAQDKDYIGDESKVIAHTKMTGGGETVSVTFDAPKKGSYDFICSFPGHYAQMKGKLIVE